MGVDVRTEIEIGRPRSEVAEYAATQAMRRENRKDLGRLKALLEAWARR